MADSIRVRFAPSPTGYLHLGNMRVALLNYLFVQQKGGAYILRIEDTDAQRTINEASYELVQDLTWLGIIFDRGPHLLDQSDDTYLQSQRTHLYQEHLNDLIELGKVYRCFCTPEELQAERSKQTKAGKPPRYSQKCRTLSRDASLEKVAAGRPFLWRFAVPHDHQITIADMARGSITFDMNHFGDFALTRSDGTFTFVFANFIDDWLMKITHVIRGEDHLSNSALQAALFEAFAVPQPTFWHLPIMVNHEGRKMSKRDFGFALHDLRAGGYLAEAIVNYLAFIGGVRLPDDEVRSMQQLITTYDFASLHATGQIHYDVDKLKWFNHQWIQRIALDDLATRVQPFLHKVLGSDEKLDQRDCVRLAQVLRPEVHTLEELAQQTVFYFSPPAINRDAIRAQFGGRGDHALEVLASSTQNDAAEELLAEMKQAARANDVPLKVLFGTLRYLFIGTFQGIGTKELAAIYGDQFAAQVRQRLAAL